MGLKKTTVASLFSKEIDETIKNVKPDPKSTYKPPQGKVNNKIGFGRKGGFGKASMRRSGRGR